MRSESPCAVLHAIGIDPITLDTGLPVTMSIRPQGTYTQAVTKDRSTGRYHHTEAGEVTDGYIKYIFEEHS